MPAAHQNTPPGISIVTAVYNRVDTIGASIDSTLSQSEVDLELVIQDGGSRDGTYEQIVARADPRVTLESGPDQGIYDAINRGIARSQGDVIGLMHSDDFFAANDILKKIKDAFADPLVDGVYGDLDYVSATDASRVIRHWRSGEYCAARRECKAN